MSTALQWDSDAYSILDVVDSSVTSWKTLEKQQANIWPHSFVYNNILKILLRKCFISSS